MHSSGFKILDKEAISTVKRAAPFRPIPRKFNRSSLTIEVTLVFQLKW
ncbi:MAG: energy transducer TonB [Candidatus Omnitrophica bacterium]|nr:energy transducer TonB [Candidatus Omnitrophota bacterium]